MHKAIATCLTLSTLLLLPALSQAEVNIQQAADRSVTVATEPTGCCWTTPARPSPPSSTIQKE
jgi:hypothetical protein